VGAEEVKPGNQAVEDWFVYIVECADATFYTGITNDLERRIDEHNAGKGARYTRGRGPVALRYYELQPDRSRASAREREIKAMSRSGKQGLIAEAAITRG
jgi:predicted GIY-YIG superfamily endonuclease